MLRRLPPPAAILTFVVSFPAPVTAGTPATISATTFLVSGHGWGHGIGLSQYGAYGYAQHGWGYKQIVLHYFHGTALGTAPVTTLRVLVAEKQKSVAIASAAPFKVRDGVGAIHAVNGLAISVGPGLKVAVDAQPFSTALPGPLTFSPAG